VSFVQSVQGPLLPQALPAVPAAQVLPLQQPPLQLVWAASPQVVSQTWVSLLHALLGGQSPCWLHPQAPLRHTWPALAAAQLAAHWWLLQQVPPPQPPLPTLPQALVQAPAAQVGMPLAHTAHAPPVVPQAPLAIPMTQLPAWQQPPLHMEWFASPHGVSHTWVIVLQDVVAGQSVALLQPHAMPPRQTWPAGDVEQLTQADPSAPQETLVVPGTHVRLTPQQPPLQGLSSMSPQFFSHVWVLRLHA
jgi:hypothetical protein